MSARKVCVVTGARSDYGLVYWLMKGIDDEPALELQVVATGMHLSPEFGLTYRQIEADGFRLAAKVEMLLSGDSDVAIVKSMGLGVTGFADAYERLRPDIVVLPGDRFEMLAAAQAALVMNIPMAHLHGGEVSEGSFDDSIRHAISKMAHWHFVAAEPYRKRVVQMGEQPANVFNFGSPGLDYLPRLQWLSRAQLEQSLGMALRSPLLLVTYHPETRAGDGPQRAMAELAGALDAFPEATVVFTYPNADTGGRAIIAAIDAYIARRGANARAFVSLGQQRYLSLMRECDVIVGNSSSGLTEAPALRKATVNIGGRQAGRLRATSVIDVAEERADIERAIREALSEPFRRRLPETVSLYGAGDAAAAMVKQLRSTLPSVRKPFFDIAHAH